MASSSSRRQHPGRVLIIFFLVMGTLYGLVALGKQWGPRLGLDLRGGTTVTLTARNLSGSGSVSASSLALAQSIIQKRVDAMGVGNVTVSTQGSNHLVVTAPNVQGEKLVKLVGQTAQLYFRNVYDVQQSVLPASASASASPVAKAPGLPRAPYAGPPGLPYAAAGDLSSRPTSPAKVLPPLATRLAWQPTQVDQAQFAAWNCADGFPDVVDQPLFACDEQGYKYLLGPGIVSGQDVTNANSGIPQGELSYAVTLTFNNKGTSEFLQATTQLSQQQQPLNQFAIVLDGRVISAPSVSQPIPGGSAQITGNFNQQTAADLANVLKYGSLPLAFDASDVQTVSATLGGDQLRAGIIAGLIGLALVVLYSFIYYHGLVVVVIGSLAIAAAITYACIVLLGQSVGFALDLPGIAGAIVAIGVTADSFIIYFERIRDEIRDGRSLRVAMETGWQKARSTLVIADMVSILSAVVLYMLAVGGVRGFAFTLGLTTLIDLAVVFFFTHPLVSLLGHTRFYGEGRKWSGLDAGHMGVSEASLLGRRARNTRRTRAAAKEAD